MAASDTAPKVVQFGMFEADLSAREVRKSGRKIKLQDQPFQVLALLLEHAGQVVDREQLREAVWPDGTFVEFDSSLNTAIKKIRQALGDSAENPRFVETLPRKGYRFIAPVSCAAPVVPASVPPGAFRRTRWIGVIIASGLGAVAIAWFLANRHSQPEAVVAPVPFTTYPGMETQPSFSPDGERVAFAWNGGKGLNFHIYVKQIGTEKPLQLTNSPALDSRPAWSPDGRLVAFIREFPDGRAGIFVVPGIGGPEKIVAESRRAMTMRRSFSPAWTPDNQWLAFPDQDSDNPADQTSSVYALRLGTGERRRLTQAPAGALDLTGAFSRDGRSLVFYRLQPAAAEVYVLRLSRDFQPEGQAEALTSTGTFTTSPAWTPDGREIVYVSLGVRSAGTVWRVPVRPPGKPTRLRELGDDIRTLAVSGQGNRLVFERALVDRDIWRIDVGAPPGQAGPPVRLISSSYPNGSPSYSPDGHRIAFASARSGHNELWICASDGSDPVQLTSLNGGQVGPPRWSPDGKRIFFDSNAGGKSRIYVIGEDGRNLRRLTDQAANDALPSLSADGHWIYFASSRSGQWEIWKMPAEGGEATAVTSNGGYVAFESPDGKYLYYARSLGAGSLWRRSLAGGPEREVAKPVLGNSLASTRHGIYFARPPAPGGGNEVGEYTFATGQVRTLATTPQPVYWYLSVSPDERFLLYTGTAPLRSDLMLVNNFR